MRDTAIHSDLMASSFSSKGLVVAGPFKRHPTKTAVYGEKIMLPGEKTEKTLGKAGKSRNEMEVLISFDGNIIYKIGGFSSLPCLMKGITNHQPGRILFRVSHGTG